MLLSFLIEFTVVVYFGLMQIVIFVVCVFVACGLYCFIMSKIMTLRRANVLKALQSEEAAAVLAQQTEPEPELTRGSTGLCVLNTQLPSVAQLECCDSYVSVVLGPVSVLVIHGLCLTDCVLCTQQPCEPDDGAR